MLDIDFSHSDKELRQILEEAQVIAIVGESNDHYYTSYQVAQYLKNMGYRVYPVNPTIDEVDGDNLPGGPEGRFRSLHAHRARTAQSFPEKLNFAFNKAKQPGDTAMGSPRSFVDI